MAYMSELHIETTPRAWVGCLACYNGGDLTGKWVDAIDAADLTPEELHGQATTHEELWVMDHENLYVTGEMSPADATEIASTLADFDGDHVALGLLIEDCHATTHTEIAEIIDTFDDRFRGAHGDTEDFAWEFCAEFVESMPENMRGYFDLEKYARDVMMDYTEIHHNGEVYIFATHW